VVVWVGVRGGTVTSTGAPTVELVPQRPRLSVMMARATIGTECDPPPISGPPPYENAAWLIYLAGFEPCGNESHDLVMEEFR